MNAPTASPTPHGLHPARRDPKLAAEVAAEVEALQREDLHGLRIRWRKAFGKEAPAHLPKFLLLRILAYRIQARAFGDLDRETARFLDNVARDWKRGRETGAVRKPKAVPRVPPPPGSDRLMPGTILVREHAGALHRVAVLDEGFAWNGTTFGSLSEVARAITGTRWNGPRFFGLRQVERGADAT